MKYETIEEGRIQTIEELKEQISVMKLNHFPKVGVYLYPISSALSHDIKGVRELIHVRSDDALTKTLRACLVVSFWIVVEKIKRCFIKRNIRRRMAVMNDVEKYK